MALLSGFDKQSAEHDDEGFALCLNFWARLIPEKEVGACAKSNKLIPTVIRDDAEKSFSPSYELRQP